MRVAVALLFLAASVSCLPHTGGVFKPQRSAASVQSGRSVFKPQLKPASLSTHGLNGKNEGLMTPERLRDAYMLPKNGGIGSIAIVVAYHYAEAMNDFNFFSAAFGLPMENSTNATNFSNRVFQQVSLTVYGTLASSQLQTDLAWNQETAMNIQWAHAIAPSAKIILVQAAEASALGLCNAVDYAARLPSVKVVSMSWGAPETQLSLNDTLLCEQAFNIDGVLFAAASGDVAAVPLYPSTSPNVVSVGGTSLFLDSKHHVMEAAFSGSGGGPSIFFPRPTYQKILGGRAGKARVTPDVALVANPYTGVNVYTSFSDNDNTTGWKTFGGTSLSVQLFAGMVNLAGWARGGKFANNTQQLLTNMYHSMRIPEAASHRRCRDITFGTAGPYIATAGWDPITGLGAPLGLGFDSPFVRQFYGPKSHRPHGHKARTSILAQ